MRGIILSRSVCPLISYYPGASKKPLPLLQCITRYLVVLTYLLTYLGTNLACSYLLDSYLLLISNLLCYSFNSLGSHLQKVVPAHSIGPNNARYPPLQSQHHQPPAPQTQPLFHERFIQPFYPASPPLPICRVGPALTDFPVENRQLSIPRILIPALQDTDLRLSELTAYLPPFRRLAQQCRATKATAGRSTVLRRCSSPTKAAPTGKLYSSDLRLTEPIFD